MSQSKEYADIYSGSQVQVLRIKDLLEEEGIPTIIQNDWNSGNMAGFLGGTPTTLRLKVRKMDFIQARNLIGNLENS